MKFETASILIPQNETFAITASIWDEALGEAASSDVLAAISWDCYASLLNGNLSGTTNISVNAGSLQRTTLPLYIRVLTKILICRKCRGNIWWPDCGRSWNRLWDHDRMLLFRNKWDNLCLKSTTIPCPRLPRDWNAPPNSHNIWIQGTTEQSGQHIEGIWRVHGLSYMQGMSTRNCFKTWTKCWWWWRCWIL